jgi:hypothetical protein
MKSYKWVPDLKEGDKLIFEGHVILDIPLPKKRIELISNLQFEVDSEAKIKMQSNQIEQFLKMELICKEHIKEIDLKHVESGIEIKSLEDLEPYYEYMTFIGACGNVILSGIKLGKN